MNAPQTKKHFTQTLVFNIVSKLIFLYYLLITCYFALALDLNTDHDTVMSPLYVHLFSEPWEIDEVSCLLLIFIINLIWTIIEKKKVFRLILY